MIDPMVSLAFSVQANKGVFAVLLGSGASRAAGVPTGWEIVLELIRKVAHVNNADCEPDPAHWYREQFNEEPDYSKLLAAIAKSPAERNQLLRSYFEPTEDECEQGFKLPTLAHKAIAELVAKGYVRVIITTNFDRLVERALEAVGVTPTVISTPDAVEGAIPLPFTQCTVVKVNGDYRDTRIKNTPAELASYDDKLNILLDRILDEYGLVVSGWSAEWDTALGAAIERCPARRFTTYWTTRSELSDVAHRLIKSRAAQVITVKDSDSFFVELAEKVAALETFAQPHPLSVQMAVATAKRYLADEHHRINLHDLLMTETARVLDEISDEHFSLNRPFSLDELKDRLRRYDATLEVLLALVVTGCHWSNELHNDLWPRCVNRIANHSKTGSGLIVWLALRRYPALLLLYAGGISAVAGERWGALAVLFKNTRVWVTSTNSEKPLIAVVQPNEVIEQRLAQDLPGLERRYTPVSDRLFEILRRPLVDVLPEDSLYEKCFDRFEFLLSLVITDLNEELGESAWGPPGRFVWKFRHSFENSPMLELKNEVVKLGGKAPLLQAGLFNGSLERFDAIYKAYVEEIMPRFRSYQAF